MPDLAQRRARLGSYAAVALVSAAVLLYEVAITRVLSVVLWYHFAFLAISLAMLGLGLPGVWFTLKKPGPAALPAALLASGVLVPASIAVMFKAGELVTHAQSAIPEVSMLLRGGMLLVLGCVLFPLLAMGSAVCLLLMRAEGRLVGRMYAADLLGATTGALFIVPLLHTVPTPLIVAGAGLLPLLATAVLAELPVGPSRRVVTGIAALIAAAVVGAMTWASPSASAW